MKAAKMHLDFSESILYSQLKECYPSNHCIHTCKMAFGTDSLLTIFLETYENKPLSVYFYSKDEQTFCNALGSLLFSNLPYAFPFVTCKVTHQVLPLKIAFE